MGEYARFNGEDIKIGTCESMYYLRYEDRARVEPVANSLNPAETEGLFYRLPFPDEDENGPGNYQDYNRGLRLYKLNARGMADDFSDETTMQEPGSIQLRHEPSGLLMNVPCYHGLRLPAPGPEMGVAWNGKSHSFELAHVKDQPEYGPMPVVRCRHCDKMWRYEWAEILPYVADEVLRARLKAYAASTLVVYCPD